MYPWQITPVTNNFFLCHSQTFLYRVLTNCKSLVPF
jgi:hypothetical protein